MDGHDMILVSIDDHMIELSSGAFEAAGVGIFD